MMPHEEQTPGTNYYVTSQITEGLCSLIDWQRKTKTMGWNARAVPKVFADEPAAIDGARRIAQSTGKAVHVYRRVAIIRP